MSTSHVAIPWINQTKYHFFTDKYSFLHGNFSKQVLPTAIKSRYSGCKTHGTRPQKYGIAVSPLKKLRGFNISLAQFTWTPTRLEAKFGKSNGGGGEQNAISGKNVKQGLEEEYEGEGSLHDLDDDDDIQDFDSLMKKLARDLGVEEIDMEEDLSEEEMIALERELNEAMMAWDEENKEDEEVGMMEVEAELSEEEGDDLEETDQVSAELLDDDELYMVYKEEVKEEDEDEEDMFYGLRDQKRKEEEPNEFEEEVENVVLSLDKFSEEEIWLALKVLRQVWAKIREWRRSNKGKSGKGRSGKAPLWSWSAEESEAMGSAVEYVMFFMEEGGDEGSTALEEEEGMEVSDSEVSRAMAVLSHIRSTCRSLEMAQVGQGVMALKELGVDVRGIKVAMRVLEEIRSGGEEKVEEEDDSEGEETSSAKQGEAKAGREKEEERKVIFAESNAWKAEEWKDRASELEEGKEGEEGVGEEEGEEEEEEGGFQAEDIFLAARVFRLLADKAAEAEAVELVTILSACEEDFVSALGQTAGLLEHMEEVHCRVEAGEAEEGGEIEVEGRVLEAALEIVDTLLEAAEEEEESSGKKGSGLPLEKLGVSFDDLELSAAVVRQMLEEGQQEAEEEVEEGISEEIEEEEPQRELRELSVQPVFSPTMVTDTRVPREEDKSPSEPSPPPLDSSAAIATASLAAGTMGSDTFRRTVQLAQWQLRKLTAALAQGKRNVNIKALAGETGLDRKDVLAFLSNPPPGLAELDLEKKKESGEGIGQGREATSANQVGSAPVSMSKNASSGAPWNPDVQRERHGKKKLSKQNAATLELVFQKTQFPTGAMVANLEELTHLPRRFILEWFSQRRGESKGKPAKGLPSIDPSNKARR